MQGPGLRDQVHYWGFVGDCEKGGLFGCEVWVSKTMSNSEGKEMCVESADLVLCSSSPRRVHVTSSLPFLLLGLPAALTPTSSASDKEKRSFWHSLRHTIRTFWS